MFGACAENAVGVAEKTGSDVSAEALAEKLAEKNEQRM
jgi:hypothetical protein